MQNARMLKRAIGIYATSFYLSFVVLTLHASNEVGHPYSSSKLFKLFVNKKESSQQIKTNLDQQKGVKTNFRIITAFPNDGDMDVIGKQMDGGFTAYMRNSLKKKSLTKVANITTSGGKGIEQIEKQYVSQIDAIGGMVTSELILNSLPLIKEHNLPLFFPLEGLPLIRNQLIDQIVYFRPSYELELEALAMFAVRIKNRSRVAIFYESSFWGDSLRESLLKILKRKNVTILAQASYMQGTVEVQEAVNMFSKFAPNAVFCLSKPRATFEFVKKAIGFGMHKCLFLGLSVLFYVQDLLKTSRGTNLVLTSVVPPFDADIQLINEYKKQKGFSVKHHSPFYLEAYIYASLLETIIEKVQPPVTAEKVKNELINIKNFDFKGLPLSFDPQGRFLSKNLWISPGVGLPWIMVNTDKYYEKMKGNHDS